jgi:putative phosphoesterase
LTNYWLEMGVRLAVLSDIHGNLPALEAVLDDIAARRPDMVLVAGDLVNRGPQPAEVVEWLRMLAYPTVKGNHERYVLDAADAVDPTEGGATFEPARWAMRQLSVGQLAYLRDLPFSLHVDDLMVVHASPRHDQDAIFLRTTEAELHEKLNSYARVVCGHTHVSLVRHWAGGLVVNVGSAGNSFEGDPRARYGWFEKRAEGWHVEIVALPYDVDAVLRAFDAGDYLETAGPMARLFRLEFATGRNHLIPAFLAHRAAVEAGVMSLADAAARYLAKR